MKELFSMFLFVDIYALAYFLSGLFLTGAARLNTTVIITSIIMSFTYTKSFKNPYLKIKGKTGIVIASILNILLVILLINSFFA